MQSADAHGADTAQEVEPGGLPRNAYTVIYTWISCMGLADFQKQYATALGVSRQDGEPPRDMREIPSGVPLRNRAYWALMGGGMFILQLLYFLASVLIQLSIPTALLFDWVENGEAHSFGALFDMPKAAAHLGPNSSTWLRICKGLIGTYVIYAIIAKDALALQAILLSRLYTWSMFWAKLLISILYVSVIFLVSLVSFVFIARTTSPVEVVLSGVGALFILEIDDVMVVWPEQHFERVRGVLWKVQHSAAYNDYNIEPEGDDVNLCLTVKNLTCATISQGPILVLWVYFLYRISGRQ